MKQLVFDSQKDDLVVRITISGVLAGSFLVRLFEPDGDTNVWESPITGNNFTPLDIPLPSPIANNNNRILLVRCKFLGVDVDNFPNFSIDVELLQEGVSVATETRSGTLTGNEQNATILIELVDSFIVEKVADTLDDN